jgi:hypothetical protein
MTPGPTAPRPRQLLVGAGAAIGGSALLVVELFDLMGQLHSTQMHDSIQHFVSSPPGDSLGVTAVGVLGFLRGLVLFNGAVAAAAAVCGVFVLRRHRQARIAYSVAAGLLLLTAPLSGVVLPVVIAVGAVLIWSRPARDWFDGRTPERAIPAAFHAHEVQQPSAAPSPRPAGEPDPTWAPPDHRLHQPARLAVLPGSTHQRRPTTVTVAAVLTWVFSALTALAFLAVLVTLVAARHRFVVALRRDPSVRGLGMSSRDLVTVLWVAGVAVVVWCLLAMVFALLAFRGIAWARIALAMCATTAAVFSGLAFPLGLLNLMAAVATVASLFRGGAGDWYAGRSGRGASAGRPPHVW